MQKLSSLRVAPELDPTQYMVGANAVDRANEQVAGSAMQAGEAFRRAGEAIKQSGPRMSAAGNAAARLGHRYVEGYGKGVKFQKGMMDLGRAVDTGAISMEHAEIVVEGLSREFGVVARAEEVAEQGFHQLANAVRNVNVRMIANETVTDGAAFANNRLAKATRLAASQQRNLQFQMMDIAQGIPLMFMSPTFAMLNFANQGAQIAQVYGQEEGGAARGLKEAGAMAGRFAVRLLPVAAVVGVAALGMAGLTHEIREATGVSVSMGEVALATWQVFASGVADYAKPALDTFVGWMGQLWDWIKPGIALAYNGIVGGFDLGFRNIKTIWNNLPSAIGDVAISTANAVLDAMELMINGAIDRLNGFIDGANEKLSVIGMNIANVSRVDFGNVANPFEGAADGLARELAFNQLTVSLSDYAADAFAAISAQAVKIHNAPSEEDIEAGKKLAEAYDSIVASAQGRIDQMGIEREALTMTTYEANILTNTQELLAKAANDNIVVTSEQRAELEALALGMADAQIALDGLKLEMEQRGPFEVMAAEIANLDDMLAQGAISWEAYAQAVERARGNALSSVTSMASEALGLLGEIFEGNKAIAIAQAVVSAGEGIARTMGAYPFPYNVGMAALHAGVAIAQIQKIMSTSKTSTSLPGGAPSGGSTPAPSAANSNQGSHQTITVVFEGDGPAKPGMEEFIDELNELLGDGATLNVQAV